MMSLSQFEVQKKPCYSCPFAGERPVKLSEERYAYFIQMIAQGRQHLCHSANNKKICRGGRDIQLRVFCAQGYLDEPTDEAFNQKVEEVLGGTSHD
jgi:hypothetical protein